jgi:hypothetical protein
MMLALLGPKSRLDDHEKNAAQGKYGQYHAESGAAASKGLVAWRCASF